MPSPQPGGSSSDCAFQKKWYRAVFVSPHLDDAVFSCGGTIAKLVHEGPVLVLNVFSSYPEDVRRGTVVIGQRRFEEEARAATLLGFESDHLGEVDAALRHDVYRSPANLFRRPVAKDMRRLEEMSDRIVEYLARVDYDGIYLPLAIGWHVDHFLCHLATERLHLQTGTLFYEDAPYCLIPNATQYRLRELGRLEESSVDPTLVSRTLVSEWYDTSRYYARLAPIKRLAPWYVRLVAPVVVSLYFRTLLSEHRSLRQDAANGYVLKPTVNTVTEQFAKKIEACYQYGSQIQEFFLDQPDCVMRYKQYSNLMSACPDRSEEMCERFWRFERKVAGAVS